MGIVVDAAEIREPDLATVGEVDLGGGECLHSARAGQHANRLLLAADFTAPRTKIVVCRAHLPVHFCSRDAERQQPVGIEFDADLALDAAISLDLADAFER